MQNELPSTNRAFVTTVGFDEGSIAVWIDTVGVQNDIAHDVERTQPGWGCGDGGQNMVDEIAPDADILPAALGLDGVIARRGYDIAVDITVGTGGT